MLLQEVSHTRPFGGLGLSHCVPTAFPVGWRAGSTFLITELESEEPIPQGLSKVPVPVYPAHPELAAMSAPTPAHPELVEGPRLLLREGFRAD